MHRFHPLFWLRASCRLMRPNHVRSHVLHVRCFVAVGKIMSVEVTNRAGTAMNISFSTPRATAALSIWQTLHVHPDQSPPKNFNCHSNYLGSILLEYPGYPSYLVFSYLTSTTHPHNPQPPRPGTVHLGKRLAQTQSAISGSATIISQGIP